MRLNEFTLSEIGLGDFVADESASVKNSRVRVELHRFDDILLDDADLQRQRRHADLCLVGNPIFCLFSFRPATIIDNNIIHGFIDLFAR